MSLSKLDYCQYLLSSPVNYTLTNMADHVEELSHDRLNRYLRGEKLTPRLLWENVREVYKPSARGYLVFDDTVLDKSFGPSIEMTLVTVLTPFADANALPKIENLTGESQTARVRLILPDGQSDEIAVATTPTALGGKTGRTQITRTAPQSNTTLVLDGSMPVAS